MLLNNMVSQIELINNFNISNVPLYIAIKDLNFKYIATTKDFANLFGITNSEIIGLSDCDLLYKNPALKYNFSKDDHTVISGKSIRILNMYITNSTHFACTKNPLIANNTICGIAINLETQYIQNDELLKLIICAPFKIPNTRYIIKRDLQLAICYYLLRGLNDTQITSELNKNLQLSPDGRITYTQVKKQREIITEEVFGLYSTATSVLHKKLSDLCFNSFIPENIYHQLITPQTIFLSN